MKNKIKQGILSLVTSVLLVGCGSDDNSDTNINTGHFIDSQVIGLSYTTSSGINGITDDTGSFQYRDGDNVNFYIGKLNFGEAKPATDGLITPRELSDNQDTVVLILRTLQSLDIDNNLSNGITISSLVTSELENISSEVLISDLTDDNDILTLSTSLAEAIDEDYDGTIDVSESVAINHFETSLSNWNGEIISNNGESQSGDEMLFDISTYPDSNLTQEVMDSLAYMGNEERLAYDIYTNLYNYHADNGTTINQLKNIPKSERKHVEIVQDVIRKYNINTDNLTDVVDPVADQNIAFDDMPMGEYDIPAIQELYNLLYDKGVASAQAALEVGCMVEVVDIDDLDHFILQAEDSNAIDVVAAFNILRDGSYSHYWAFDKGLKNMGVSEGCAVAGDEWAKTIEEYPTTIKGNGRH